MTCPSCAFENGDENAYCGKCGSVLNDAFASVPRYRDQRRLVKREIAIVFGGVSVLLLAAWIAWYLLVSSRSPTSVVQAFIESDRTGQYTRQEALIANSWDSRMSLSLFQTIRKQSGSSPFQKYRIVGNHPGGTNSSYVDVELTVATPTLPLFAPAAPPANPGGNNAKILVTFVLIRQGDDWKIDSSQTLASVVSALAAQGLQQFQMNGPNFPNIPVPPGWPNLGAPLNAPPARNGGQGRPQPSGSGNIL